METSRTMLHEILFAGAHSGSIAESAIEARRIIERFKADTVARHARSVPGHAIHGELLKDLAGLRDAVDREVDRRVDGDITDNLCDLLEQLSILLHEETCTPDERGSGGPYRISE